MNGAGRTVAITPAQRDVLDSSEWFAALDAAFREAVLASSRIMTVTAGGAVFHRGDPCDGLYCVLSGAVCFSGSAPSGRGSIAAMVEAPQWFGEIALSTADRAPTTPLPTSPRHCCICRFVI